MPLKWGSPIGFDLNVSVVLPEIVRQRFLTPLNGYYHQVLHLETHHSEPHNVLPHNPSGFHVATSVVLSIFLSRSARADVLSTIEQECAALGATQYQIAFVTSAGTQAGNTNISFYNNFVSAQALTGSSNLDDFVSLGTSWTAIGSTSAVSTKRECARTCILLQYSIRVANSLLMQRFHYSASLVNPVDYDQFGLLSTNGVWTGASPVETGGVLGGGIDSTPTLGECSSTTGS